MGVPPSDHPAAASAAIVQLFCNPASGSYSPRKIAALVVAFESLGASVRIEWSEDQPPVIADDVTHICIAAGDGTVRHVASAVARSGRTPIVAIYPNGTVNLLAMEGRYSADPVRFARHLLLGSSLRPHYPVRIGEEMFFACASVGPDTAAMAHLSVAAKRRIGRFAYLVAFGTVLRHWPHDRIEIDIDGTRRTCGAFYVAKSRYYAGRWSFAPTARVDRPVLHVVLLESSRRRDFASFVWAMLLGADPAGVKGIRSFTCTSLSARCARPAPLQADGDILTALPAAAALTMAVEMRPVLFR